MYLLINTTDAFIHPVNFRHSQFRFTYPLRLSSLPLGTSYLPATPSPTVLLSPPSGHVPRHTCDPKLFPRFPRWHFRITSIFRRPAILDRLARKCVG